MPLVISYLRFSSKGQIGNDSVRRQLEKSAAWAKEKGVVLDDTVRDDAVSAFRGLNAETGGLGSILRKIQSHEIPSGSTLLVESLDRLSRSSVNIALPLMLQIVNAGVTIVTLIDKQTYTPENVKNPMQIFGSLMIMTRAHEESLTKSVRISDAWNKRRIAAKNGELLSNHVPAWLKIENEKIVIDKPKAAIVKYIIDLALKGIGPNGICRRLNSEKIEPIAEGRGKVRQWYASYVSSILREGAVIGHKIVNKHQGNKRVPIETIYDYYPPIVSHEVYEQVQAVLDTRKQRGEVRPKTQYSRGMLGGLLVDARGMTYRNFTRQASSEHERIRYYAEWESQKERRQYVRADMLETVIIQKILSHDADSVVAMDDKPSTKPSEHAKQTAELLSIEKRIADIEDQLTETDAPIPALVKAMNTLEARRTKLEKILKAAKSESVLTEADVMWQSMHRLGSIYKNEPSLTQVEEINGLLRKLCRKITLTIREGIDETMSKPRIGGDVVIEVRRGGPIRFGFSYSRRQKTQLDTMMSLQTADTFEASVNISEFVT